MGNNITKYDYITFKRCRRLWGYIRKEYKRSDTGGNALQDFLSTQGKQIGLLAQELFRGRGACTIGEKNTRVAIIETQKALVTADVLFEGAFEHDVLITRPDILDLKNMQLIEVKSTTEVKDEHILDVAFQKYILEKCGHKTTSVKICHVNKQYLYGNTIDLNEFFTFIDVTENAISKFFEIEKDLGIMKKIIEDGDLPQMEIGRHCNDDIKCPYIERCWGGSINDTIFDLRRDVCGKKYVLHKEGVRSLKDIPESVTLTKYQTLQRKAEIKGCAVINQLAITEALHEVTFPIFFLDFESFSEARPRYPQTYSFQQIPFQASLHVLGNFKKKPKHYSFLHSDDSDPRYLLANFLIEKLGNAGSIVAYHASFEVARLYELIKVVPEKEGEILALIDRVWDLETIFDKGMYVHPGFKGSTSIKKILPIMVPELSYEDLEINNGALAAVEYLKMISPGASKEQKEKIINDLEKYCMRDTYAMYAILKKFFMEVI